MALITAPTGEAIYKRAKRLDPDHFEDVETEDDIKAMFSDVVSPAVLAKYTELVDPYVAAQYPDYTAEQRAEWIANQSPRFSDSMMYEALSIAYSLVDSSNEWYSEQEDKYRELAMDARKEELKQFEKLLALDSPSNVGGIGLLAIDLSDVSATDEYSQ